MASFGIEFGEGDETKQTSVKKSSFSLSQWEGLIEQGVLFILQERQISKSPDSEN